MRQETSRIRKLCVASLLIWMSGLVQPSHAAEPASQGAFSAKPLNSGGALSTPTSGTTFVANLGVQILVEGWEETQNGCYFNFGSWTITHLPTHGTAGQVEVDVGCDRYNTITYTWTDSGVTVVPCQTQDTMSATWKSDDGMFVEPGSWTFVYFPRSLTAYYSLCGPGGTGRSSVWWYSHVGQNIYNGIWSFLNGNSPPNGRSGLQPSFTVMGTVSDNWSLISQRDFNGDGTADVLWRDSSVGALAIWLMNGTQVASATSLGAVPTNWSVVGTGDFNNDRNADILWRDTSGNLALWLMNGAQISSAISLGNVSTSWSVAGVADFNQDGNADILWRDGSGNVAIWLMKAGQISSAALIGNVPNSWAIAGIGDFNGDGKADILWRDTSGNVAIWFMNGAQVSSGAFVGNVPTSWSIVDTGDFNGDGKSDIVWRDTSGNVAIWEMNGGTIASTNAFGIVDPSWLISSANSE